MTVRDDISPGTRLLVVDDEPAILDVLATSLRFLGYEVAEATTGRAALTAA
ncbi:DNA-binding response regulator, partial [Streptomyces sp. SID11233]|nr:DNA-binding response regulator [Streptomyces sp. SID11233]